MKDIKTK